MILQACPSCARQYDVAHLEPGSSVRCLCDVRFVVKPPRDLRVRGLRCRHCGAPVSAENEDCPYCEAALDERDRMGSLCPACFARVEDGAVHCGSCGTRIDPQALPPIPAGATCPRCQGELSIRSLEIASVIECAGCGGLWLEPRLFQELCRDARRDSIGALAARGEDAPAPKAVGRQSYIPCLDCGELMLRRQFKHRARPTGVVLDYCRDHGIWFDGEELTRILNAIRSGSESAPDPGVLDEALRPRREIRTLPVGVEPSPPRSLRFTYRDVLRTLGDLIL